jgi:signal transduction histidine kinase
MKTPVGRRLAAIAAPPHLSRRTIRFRLTLAYGLLFLVSGALALTITYALVDRATTQDAASLRLPDGSVVSVGGPRAGEPPSSPVTELAGGPGAAPRTSGYISPGQALRLVAKQHADQMHQLLVQSGIALGTMALLSIGLGWIVAGRVLQPLHTITSTARRISAANLGERLALDGPNDELKDLADTFDDLLGRLEGSFLAQRRFVANASHELRTPLTRQRTLSEVALADPDATVESLRGAHERVLASGREQEALIEALLVLARGQAGLGRSELFDLAAVLREAIVARQADAAARAVAIDDTLLPAAVRGDRALVEQLVANLVDNAIRHNVPGGRVDCSTTTDNEQATLTVTNTGPVIAPDDVRSLVEPFQRLGPARLAHREGLGLGLSIVDAIAAAHQATLSLEPQPEGGLIVEVRFPRHSASSAEPAHAVGAAVPPRESAAGRAPNTSAKRDTASSTSTTGRPPNAAPQQPRPMA